MMNRVVVGINRLVRVTPSRHWLCGRMLGNLYHTDYGVYGHRPRAKKTTAMPFHENRVKHANLFRLVTAYRQHGHKKANVDPLELLSRHTSGELATDYYGLSEASGELFPTDGLVNMQQEQASLSEIIQHLEHVYCGMMSAEFVHLQDFAQREWFAAHYEEIQRSQLTDAEKIHHAKLMLKSQAWDHFLSSKFSTVKRYGGEGAETAMCFYDELFKLCAQDGVNDLIMCMAHRGRLNLMSCLLQYPTQLMFRKMKGLREFPDDVVGAGDVLSHLTPSTDLQYGDRQLHVTMVPNPSHLESANPVAVGKTRAREMSKGSGHYSPQGLGSEPQRAVCFQVHGDAAVAAQGVVAETFALADVPHFSVGGSLHLIINNQLGFTTPAERARSSLYSSCIGKMNAHPVIHVNGDYPEAVVKACRLATEYRRTFHRDIIIDLVCYRKWGHNEVDDPSFTQPKMYDAIRNRDTTPDAYAQLLVDQGLCTMDELTQVAQDFTAQLAQQLAETDQYVPKANHLDDQWSGFQQPKPQVSVWDTGAELDVLKFIGAQSVTVPEDHVVHKTLKKSHVERRLQRLESGKDIDWATAESLAIGSLLHSGYNVRISGQDVGRGTFSHRHFMLVDQESDSAYIPLNNITSNQQGQLEVCNSILSEEAVLGFEYGMSIENPKSLTIWEAQFGDFFNGAQIIIDTFVTCGETKWLLQSGLIMLLPHGMDGAGPDHSSCRMERFLQLSDSKEDGIDGEDVNIQIVNPTTPAQYFHMLRRQMIRPFRKPLVVAAPKTLLRLSSATSELSDMIPGTSFRSLLPDPTADPAKVKKVVFVSGRLYYVLAKERETRNVQDMAIVRLEELCPFPAEAIQQQLAVYKNATDFVWSQEEHRNMGAWSFVSPRFENLAGIKLRYVGRGVHATPATGVGQIHRKESEQLIADTFA